MKATIAEYKNHQVAVEALNILEKRLFPKGKIPVENNINDIENNMRIMLKQSRELLPFMIGVAISSLIGFLIGIGVLILPDISRLNAIGGLVGSLIGFVVAVVLGGIISIMYTVLRRKKKVPLITGLYKLNSKYELIVEGTSKDVALAEKIILEEYPNSAIPHGV